LEEIMIVVTGGTGFIGRHVVERLMAEGRPVRLLLNAARAENLPFKTPPEVVVGSILDEEALFKAVTGAHAIIHLENAQWWGRQRDLERIELQGTRLLISSARAARVGRILTVSQLGASPASGYPLLRYKGMVEEAVRTSGLAYTIIRSGLVYGQGDAFVDHLAMQFAANPFFFLMPGQGEIVLHPLHIDDLVSAIIAALDTLDVIDTTVEIGGPEYITLADLLQTVMRVTGMHRFVLSVPPYLLRWLTAAYGLVVPRSLITNQWLDILASNRTARIGTIFQVFGVRPARFEDTLLTYMRGRRYGRLLLRYTFQRRPRIL
jgi:NADH dehydrogenase